MTISATDMVVPVCFKTPLLCLLTQKTAQKFGYVLGIKNMAKEQIFIANIYLAVLENHLFKFHIYRFYFHFV